MPDLGYEAKRLVDVGRALRLARTLAAHERLTPAQLARLQRERVEAIVRHAVAGSPFYRERLPVGDGPIELGRLPTLDKATMMEHFDDLVCDRRLRRDALLEHVDGLDRDALYLGEHRVMTTSGSSGLKGLFVYDRDAWVAVLAQFLRFNAMIGVRPRLPRLRIAAIGGGAPTHMSRRGAATLSVGLHRILSLPVTMPLPRLVDELNAFQPEYVNAYPSIAVQLAGEQLAGRLRIAPACLSTSSELRTREMAAKIESAFGVRPFDLYATTEGLWAGECEHRAGVHLFEDLTVVENVDDAGRPVPDGVPGARLLVTSLFNRVQPLIRFELSDLVTIDPEPCPCGRPLRRMRAIEGRADDVICIGGVVVLPAQFSVVTADRDVREFQVVQEGDRLRLRVALRDGAPVSDASARLRERVASRLSELGVREPHVRVETCAGIERPAGGKLRMVVAEIR